MKNKFIRMISIGLSVLLLTGCGAPAAGEEKTEPIASVSTEVTAAAETETETAEESGDQEVSLKDDFYAAVNAQWMATAQIPADMPVAGGFTDLSEDIEKLLMADFDAMLKGEKETADPLLNNFLDYYRLAADFDYLRASFEEIIKVT